MKTVGTLESGHLLVAMAQEEFDGITDAREKGQELDVIIDLLAKYASPSQKIPVKKPAKAPVKKKPVKKPAPKPAVPAKEPDPPPEKKAEKQPWTEPTDKSAPMIAVLRGEIDTRDLNVTAGTAAEIATELGYETNSRLMGINLASSPKYFVRVGTGMYRAKTRTEMVEDAAAKTEKK